MRKKITLIGVVALMLLAAVPGVAFAKDQAFSATGGLNQDFAGNVNPGAIAPPYALFFEAEADAPSIAAPFFGLVGSLAGITPFTPGIRTLNHEFSGTLTDSNWGAIKNSDVQVTQNSWYTAPLGLLGAPDGLGGIITSVPMVGVAWGSFELSKGEGNSASGAYAAVITGSVSIDGSTCAVGAPGIDIVDLGVWVDAGGHGALGKIDSNGALGDLVVTAIGCFGGEQAAVTVNGTR